MTVNNDMSTVNMNTYSEQTRQHNPDQNNFKVHKYKYKYNR